MSISRQHYTQFHESPECHIKWVCRHLLTLSSHRFHDEQVQQIAGKGILSHRAAGTSPLWTWCFPALMVWSPSWCYLEQLSTFQASGHLMSFLRDFWDLEHRGRQLWEEEELKGGIQPEDLSYKAFGPLSPAKQRLLEQGGEGRQPFFLQKRKCHAVSTHLSHIQTKVKREQGFWNVTFTRGEGGKLSFVYIWGSKTVTKCELLSAQSLVKIRRNDGLPVLSSESLFLFLDKMRNFSLQTLFFLSFCYEKSYLRIS